MKTYLNKYLKGPDHRELISNFDFYKYFGSTLPIIKATDLQKYSIDIFNNKFKSVIILIENSEGNHWVLMSKVNKSIEFFDSYGCDYSFYFDKILDILGNLKVVSNKIRYQEMSAEINTCGKHVSFRLMALIEYKMGLRKYQKFMKYLKDHYKGSYDDIVSIFVSL